MKKIQTIFKRGDFLVKGLIVLIFQFACSHKASQLEKGATLNEMEGHFVNPPDSVKPWVFWQWMNGNITKEGITLDLETMKRMGIGGALCFNNAVGIPRGSVDYASEAWFDMTEYAVKEAQRLGLKIMLHNSPGYSGTGGPWVTPETSMQELTWVEVQNVRGKNIDIKLSQPHARMDYYADAYVLAYPSLTSETGLMRDKITSLFVNGSEVETSLLTDHNPETKIRLEGKGEPNEVVFKFEKEFNAQSITVFRTENEEPYDLFDGPRDHPPHFVLKSSIDGLNYTKIAEWGMPQLREGNTPGMQNFNSVKAKYFKLIASSRTWISEVELHSAPRLEGWPGKADFTHGNYGGNTVDIREEDIIKSESVIDVTKLMDDKGNLKWDAPTGGPWTIVRIGHTTTGEENAAHPDAGKGLEIDKLNRAALDFQFEKFNSKVVERLKPYIRKGFYGFTTDSWECGKQNWSVVMPDAFREKNKYEITSWVLALTGRIVDGKDETEKFLKDFNDTQIGLLGDNYYGYWNQLCDEHNIDYYAEPYGDGTLDGLTACKYLDVPMCEFWTRHIYGSDKYSKQAASGAHLYGKPVVAAECFTGMPLTSKWTAHPYALKAGGDYFYSLGVNRFTFHVFVHQPYTTGTPGMTMGPFGSHFDRNNTWTDQAYGWINYLTRCQYILQQGKPVVDACYFKGEEPSSVVPDVYPMMPAGFKCDVFGPDALHNRFKIEDRRIVLPDGMQYKVAIMAPLQEIKLSTLKCFKELVEEGMILVVNNKPIKSYGNESNDQDIQGFVSELYGELDGQKVTRRKVGKGLLIWGEQLEDVFSSLDMQPDFTYTSEKGDAVINYFHKNIGDADVYFVSNYSRRSDKVVTSFNITDKLPEFWNAETGEIVEAPVYRYENGRTIIPFDFDPSESCFVVFRKETSKERDITVSKDHKIFFGIESFREFDKLQNNNITNSFSVSAWIKPETFAHNGRGYILHPVSGEKTFGKGHAMVGLAAGKNGIVVYESDTRTSAVLGYNQPLQGWSHVVLAYNNRKPYLYVNGKLVAEGEKSKAIVHPGYKTGYWGKAFNNWFEGDLSDYESKKSVLTDVEVKKIYQGGLPENGLIPDVKLSVNKHAKVSALFLSNGVYRINTPEGKAEQVNIQNCKTEDLSYDWGIEFPINSGVDKVIDMPVLSSLINHDNFDVRHFSGTCTYKKGITINTIKSNCKVLLDLGRVEVIAKVFVNGKEAALLWKEPYMTDITDLVKEGENELRIEVTNLWINRLIGDEYLPVENKYTTNKNIEELPQWFVNNQPKPGNRKAFSVWRSYTKEEPLVDSGILGPVKLIYGVEKEL
ncbi:glycosyl hydrolase [Saccharicrinis sp. FJH62]|uniref:glycosyl hydrolase n=1 Tax=Saccharicrinis sp. FJH62 TaxID=3344657 RepID=UPI0035D4A940